MKKATTVLAIILAFAMLLCSCEKKNEENGSTSDDETTKAFEPSHAEVETIKAPETTAPATTTASPETTSQQTEPSSENPGTCGESGGDEWNYGSGGGSISFGGGGSSGSGSSQFQNGSGKNLVHTYSDRAAEWEDNSETVPYMLMKSPYVTSEPGASYNTPKILLADIKPGAVCEGVVVGYDDYMFYQDTINDFIGSGFLSQTLYDRAVQMLRDRNNWANSHGMKFYFVIAPNKNTVYPDYMPEGYTMASYRRYDQFVALLREAGITAVDLRGAMSAALAANPEKNLYYKYDTHWNNHAGYVAYAELMRTIRADYPNAVFHDKSEYQINYCETYMKDLAYYLGYYDRFVDYGPVYTLKSGMTARLVNYIPKDAWGQFVFANTSSDGYSDKLYYFQYRNDYNSSAPNIYVMRDSYSIALVPFLKDSFYNSTYNWTFSFSENDILKSGADIVLVVAAERNLRNYVNNKSVAD